MPDKDEHYVKYRLFYEPEDTNEEGFGHPVDMKAEFLVNGPDEKGFEIWAEASEVEGLFFVLRPENDNYARIAMAAYAYACRQEFPHLAVDIIQMIEGLEWEEQTGQHSGDFPLTEDDYLDPSGDQLSDNVIQMLRQRKNV